MLTLWLFFDESLLLNEACLSSAEVRVRHRTADAGWRLVLPQPLVNDLAQ
jgi:hypothetical protein